MHWKKIERKKYFCFLTKQMILTFVLSILNLKNATKMCSSISFLFRIMSLFWHLIPLLSATRLTPPQFICEVSLSVFVLSVYLCLNMSTLFYLHTRL
uniref:Transmembrane protein 258 n=1 Tax=Pseudodiaptomus poplesia TaxID=213370 RepID=A0A1S6GL83_9MAXI|nr:transmembrane protein 258 [Pseudodiaptomus poplesia]